MTSIFDIYSVALLVVSLTMFIVRYIREEPPVTPYLVIALTCGVGNYLGEAGGGVGALMLLVAASFLFLGCLLYPTFRSRSRGKRDAA
ncbi:MAG: XrtV sorting system accessory protein [Pseudomonadota bacterium]